MKKTAIKSAKPSPISGTSLPVGAHPGNTGGKKGRSGRKPDWLKTFCAEILADRTAQEQVRAILRDKGHPAYASMWKAVADRGFGKPKESVEVTGADGAPVQMQVWRFGQRHIVF